MKHISGHRYSAFTRCYVKALAAAACAFGLSHAVQAIVVSENRYGVAAPRVDAFLPLTFFELTQSLIFFVVAIIVVLLPARVADNYIRPSSTKMVSLFSALGVLAGITFLPLCAGVSVSILPSIDDPTYLERCAEYLIPMMLAGMIGGHVFAACRAAHLRTGGSA